MARDDQRATGDGGGEGGDLSVTALYTSQVWRWARLPGATLYDMSRARVVYRVTNLVMGVVRLFRWGLFSLKWSLLHRHAMIDHLLRASGATRVLELAAGLSRRGAAFSADPAVDYTEVDVPHVVADKRALLARTDAGRAVAERENLHMRAADVTETPLSDLVEPAPGLFVIAEGLFMYFDPATQRRLWAAIAAFLRDGGGGVFVFDLTPTPEEPRPGPLGRALSWLMTRFTGGQAFNRDDRTRDDLTSDLRAAGFDAVTLHEPQGVASTWNLPRPRARTKVVLFECRVRPRLERSPLSP